MVIATNNNGKIEEIKKILTTYEIYSLKDKNIKTDIQEDQNSFVGNAKKKAYEIYNIIHEPVIADDSGLLINALDGFPGVNTHRFMENVSDTIKNEYLLNEVNKYDDRSAKVVCDIVYYDGNDYIVCEGTLNGFISRERRGNNGFGFDEIFELPNGKTLAELSIDEKNKISARALALAKLKEKIN